MFEPTTPLINNDSFNQQQQNFQNSPNKSKIQNKLLNLKLKRINELNNRLKDTLTKDRIYASNASYSIIDYTQSTKDFTLPEIWGNLQPGENPFRNNKFQQLKNPNSNGGNQDGCCTIM
ncbi:Guanine nucleotide-binding protein subunit gamma [Wickerhamomyces ciferrii]|uniref:Guanine nucleotide-binding protein subunit gamma n=1 Tax=Wickerhamomyces ciferrii (strain ATCC 14091 / BCRC 22168 / CBS 111 / JCM 3599 / NBRC 0793 / NRRL Y-1031 F-60-10) TaxID=1206466 RepID=K0KN95_WICCF|nr:Guanine nucleotide-binding protein subunit gamma [Wickerhamomyces ciferrii]CCH42598.1 Guanine nucleotide-binding protein subunit gamma [Wickerhamomyces ciferrii]